jgi:hypothetical protein
VPKSAGGECDVDLSEVVLSLADNADFSDMKGVFAGSSMTDMLYAR